MTDREADEYELTLHRKSAVRGWAIGGALIALGTAIFLAKGWAFIGLLLLPGALSISNAWTHRTKANAIAMRLASPAYAHAPAHAYPMAPGVPALGRGTRVAVTWVNGARYPAHVLEVRGAHVLVQFQGGRQDWAPVAQVQPDAGPNWRA